MLIKYNLMAVAAAIVGVFNTVLTWKLFGATDSADVWLLGLAITSTLALLVLLGVEQFLVFYTNILTENPREAGSFASIAVIWALLSGFLFALLCFGANQLLITWFAGGLSAETKRSAASMLLLLLPQIAAAPLLHVTRCALNAHGKYGRSYALLLIIPSALLIAQLYFVVAGNGRVHDLGWVVAIGAVLQLMICIRMILPWCTAIVNPITKDFWALLRNSVTMRIGHSFHNFFVGMIINNALSHQAAGMISIFQYAKRFADGVAAVSVGPQVNIFNSRQALAWAARDYSLFKKNIKTYISIVLPLFVAVALLVLLTLPELLKLLGRGNAIFSIGAIQVTFAALVVWQGLISLEAIYVTVVITARESFILWGVNGLFVVSFYFYVTKIPADSPVWYVALVAILAQLVSILGYGLAALFLARKQFKTELLRKVI